MGLELSGVIVEAEDESWINKEVCALVPGGAYAEYCIADKNLCLSIPFAKDDEAEKEYSRFAKAAGIVENLFTVWKNLFRHKDMVNNARSLLIHGGSGGIGLTATQLAKNKHFRGGIEKIFVTAGSDDKCQRCLDLGADFALNYKDTDKPWDEIVKEEGKVDIILDIVGGDYLAKNLSCLNRKGRLINLGFMGKTGPIAKEFNLTPLLLKGLTITGSVLRSNPIEEKITLKEEIEADVWPIIKAGEMEIPAHISHVFKGITETQKALETVMSSQHFGKVIVEL